MLAPAPFIAMLCKKIETMILVKKKLEQHCAPFFLLFNKE